MPPARKRYLAVLALLLTVTIWGTTFAVTKVALREVQPFTLTLLRFLLGCMALAPLAWAEQRRHKRKIAGRRLALAGLIGGGLYLAAQNLGLAYTTASKGSLILASIPALTGFLAALWLQEKMGYARLVGIGASVLGVAVIVLVDRAASWGGTLLGDLLLVGAAISWAVYSILSKELEREASPVILSAATVSLGAVFILPFAGYEALVQPLALPSLDGWLAIGYLGLVASTVPILLWNYALRRMDASEAAVYVNLVPVVGVGTAVLWLHEAVTPAQVLGGLLVLAGVWAAGRRAGT
ncbi:MAG: EamA family transporter [Anaerolineae bacterium]|nr:EamA family transporter [Anaerolineae bacterium]